MMFGLHWSYGSLEDHCEIEDLHFRVEIVPPTLYVYYGGKTFGPVQISREVDVIAKILELI